MGKGDKKSRRGKIAIGSYGVRRPRKKYGKLELKPKSIAIEPDIKKVKETKITPPVAEVEVVKKPKVVKEKKVVKENKAVKTPKPKKEKTS